MNNKIYEKANHTALPFQMGLHPDWIGSSLLHISTLQLSDFEWRSLPCSGRG